MAIIINYLNRVHKINSQFTLGEKSFYLGTFFLSSALPISLFFFLISIICSIYFEKIYKLNKYNFLLLICSGLMIISSIKSINNFDYLNSINFQDKSKIIIDLLNWIPLFLFFLSSQRYLKTSKNRRLFGQILISGSIPVIISCILQYWFKIYGPFETLNGLIIWFQKKRVYSGVTGLFNNQNYTGIWLTTFLPFLITEFVNFKKDIKKKPILTLFLLLFLFLTIFFIFLTSSRNAYLGLFVIFFMFYGLRNYFLIPLITLIPILSFKLLNNSILKSDRTTNNLFIDKIIDTINFAPYSFSRIEGYTVAIKGIFKKPFLGFGANTFPYFYENYGGKWGVSHTHSMPVEIAFNYGLPTSIFLSIFVLILLINAFKKIYKLFLNNIFTVDKAWIIASVIVVINHIFDVTYYEGKISLLIWILLAGLKCIIDENSIKESHIK